MLWIAAICFCDAARTATTRLTSYYSFCTIGEEEIVSDAKGENNVICILSEMQHMHEGEEVAG